MMRMMALSESGVSKQNIGGIIERKIRVGHPCPVDNPKKCSLVF
jgi:hypothetical protein